MASKSFRFRMEAELGRGAPYDHEARGACVIPSVFSVAAGGAARQRLYFNYLI